ncbi:MAG: hypothetical protein K8I60_22430, partial [Anaerolineae bacterium]|nr:hypothetical protein [Anaerolineae bacterium]
MIYTVKRFLMVTITLMVLIVFSNIALAQDKTETLSFGGVDRTFYVHLPANYDESTLAPLLIALHSTSSSGRALAALTGLNAASDEQGFIAVYPNADGVQWGEDPTETDTPDDIGFIGSLLDYLEATYAVDQEHIYLAGLGNGGLMTYRLACETPERFAGFAVVSALMWDNHRQNCPAETASPVNMLIMHGSADVFYEPNTHNYTNIFSTDEGPIILGIADTLLFWADRNQCEGEAVIPQGQESNLIFGNCANSTRTAYYEVAGGSGWPRIGDYRLNQFGVDATTVITSFFAGGTDELPLQAEPYTGLARSYALYVPASYDPAVPMPLVMMLHGRFGTGAGMAALTDMNILAEKYGFIGLYPDGIDNQWNYVRNIPGYPDAQDDNVFLSNLIADVSLNLNVDQTRIYVAGFSNGGFMTGRLACENPNQYAAFATVSAAGFGGMLSVCPEGHPIAMLMMHGTADTNVPWDGQAYTRGDRTIYSLVPVADTLSFWAQYIDCEPSLETEELPQQGGSPGTMVKRLVVSGCPENAGLILYAVLGGGHNWPGKPGRIADEVAGL